MPKRRNEFAAEVAGSLFEYERNLDRTIASGSMLIAKLVEGRSEVRLAASVGQEALDELAASIVGLVRTRRSVVGSHSCLDATRQQLKLQEVAAGDKVANPQVFIPVEGHLRAVG